MDRDQWTCQYCASTERTLNVHHLRYVGDPWDCPDELLITLCDYCHTAEEALKRTDFYSYVEESRMTRLVFINLLRYIDFKVCKTSPLYGSVEAAVLNEVIRKIIEPHEHDEFLLYLGDGSIPEIVEYGEEVN